ncbi:MAG TPA: S41 family peptidase [Pyrinomonadaceae bacterium]|nr:S41 family peptidase [Pyrinomonadaceae bacterium]
MRKPLWLLIPVIVLFVSAHPVSSQSLSGQDRDRGLIMLKAVRDDIRKNYYDPELRGIDLDARAKAAEERIKQAKSNAEVFGIIAQMLLDFNDSHTLFLPPERAARIEYGWQLQTFGDDPYVIAVKPKSDAEAKGLKPGDKVLAIDGVTPTRANLWIYQYLYNVLKPRQIVNVQVQAPGEQPRQLELKAKVQTGKVIFDFTSSHDFNTYQRELEDEYRMGAHRFVEVGNDIVIWRLPSFDLTEDGVDEYVDKVKKAKTLILDLRRNGGGAVETLRRLVGNLFDRDITIGDQKLRKESKPMIAKTRGASGFKGRLIVLVDSNSGSASEVLARVVQLEKRGTVVGDRTSGKVMRSRIYPHQIGLDTVVFYAVSVTDADLIMTDGKSLEHVGVTPDELVLPTAEDLRLQKDSVLSRAVEMAGAKIDPVEAGKLFPFKWKP